MQMDYRKKLIPWRSYHRSPIGKVMHDDLALRFKHIYRMLTWHHAKMLIDDGRFWLSPVKNWARGDPYEAWWCDIVFKGPGNLSKAHAYGSCWTTRYSDEPFWRMAGFDREVSQLPIVRIRTTPRQLLEAGMKFVEHSPGALYLGKLRYRKEDELRPLAETFRTRKPVTRTVADLLFQKRNAYRFESEVRLLWISEEDAADGLTFPINPSDFISQVMISPYAQKDQVREVREYCGAKNIPVARSLVLKPPKPMN